MWHDQYLFRARDQLHVRLDALHLLDKMQGGLLTEQIGMPALCVSLCIMHAPLGNAALWPKSQLIRTEKLPSAPWHA